MAIMATSEARVATSEDHKVMEARVVAAASEVHRVTEVLVEITLEAQTIMVTSVAQVVTATSEVHRVMEARVVAAASEVHRVTEVLVEVALEAHRVTVARREDLREPLQMADAETGPTTKVVPTIV